MRNQEKKVWNTFEKNWKHSRQKKHRIYHWPWIKNVTSLTLSTLTFLNAFWRSFQFCINSCSSFAWNFTFFNGIQSKAKSMFIWYVNTEMNLLYRWLICVLFEWLISLPTWCSNQNIYDWQSFVSFPPMKIGKEKRWQNFIQKTSELVTVKSIFRFMEHWSNDLGKWVSILRLRAQNHQVALWVTMPFIILRFHLSFFKNSLQLGNYKEPVFS